MFMKTPEYWNQNPRNEFIFRNFLSQTWSLFFCQLHCHDSCGHEAKCWDFKRLSILPLSEKFDEDRRRLRGLYKHKKFFHKLLNKILMIFLFLKRSKYIVKCVTSNISPTEVESQFAPGIILFVVHHSNRAFIASIGSLFITM